MLKYPAMRRFVHFAALAACLSAPAGSFAQGRLSAEPVPPPPKNADAGRRATLDDLFARLAAAKDEAEAKGVAGLIERRWLRSGSDTADLLLTRATEAINAKEYPLAIELLDRVLALEPQWVEAWYRRANVFFLMDDPIDALADLKQVLTREPRHFAAWTGLGHIYMNSDDKPRALQAYRKALSIHPKLSTVETLVERLKPTVDGLDL